MSVIVIEFITLDAIVSDPDGSDGTPAGGWAFRHGPEAVAGDKFQLGTVLDQGVMLLGRKTWELFARIWPGRDTPFAARMNAVPKLVASRTLTDTAAFPNSKVIDGDPVAAVRDEPRDVIITGSLPSLVHALQAGDLVDEYRLLTFPTVLGAGRRAPVPGRPPAPPPGMLLSRSDRTSRAVPVRPGAAMTARFLAAYVTPADPAAFDRHYQEVHIPLLRQLPGLRRCTMSRDVTALHGAPFLPDRRAGLGSTTGRPARRVRHARGPGHRGRRGPPPGTSPRPQNDLHC